MEEPADWTLVRTPAPDPLLPHEEAFLAAIARPTTVTALGRNTRALNAVQKAPVAIAVGW